MDSEKYPYHDHKIVLKSVDFLQGMERSIFVFSLTRRNSRNNVGFLSDNSWFNIATSCAFHLLVLVGNAITLRRSEFIRSLLTVIENKETSTLL